VSAACRPCARRRSHAACTRLLWQNLVEKILRLRIYNDTYWKEACFGLTGDATAMHMLDGSVGRACARCWRAQLRCPCVSLVQ
jgi:hypothetical protein